MSLAFLRGALNCGYLHLRLSLPPFSLCLPASLPPCLLLPPCLPASLPLTASLPPCLLASLPPCLPASLPPCLPASLLSLPPSLPLAASLYLSQPLSTSRCLSLPLAASLCLSSPPFASLCLSITLHCVVRVRYCCQSQHFHDTMHHSLVFLHNRRHHQGESDLKRWSLSPSSLCRVVYRGTLSGIEP
jgi:hypothetical protein